jgi:predicted nucleic acid-binding protein
MNNPLMVCLDASFIVRFLTENNHDSIYHKKWQQWKQDKYILIAPNLIMYEISNAFHRAVIGEYITQREAEDFLLKALSLNLKLYGDKELHQDALKLANLFRLPATYDAHYLALANRFNVELWTADRRLFNAVSPDLPWVKLV